MTAILGILLGLAIFAQGWTTDEGPHESMRIRPLFFISAAVILFALLIERFGLVPAIIVAAGVSALSDRETRPWEAVALAACMAFAIWLIFIRLLGLPIPAF
jgi:hypothetical protein